MQAPSADLDRFLREAAGQERFAWSGPASVERLGGSGIAAELSVLPNLDEELTPADSPLYEAIELQARRLFTGAHHWQVDTSGRPRPLPHHGRPHPARPRLFGGFSFRPDFTPDNTWSCFRPAHFVLPHYQLTLCGDEKWLTINALVAATDLHHEGVERYVEELAEALQTRAALPWPTQAENAPRTIAPSDLRRLSYPMSAEAWETLITAATRLIRSGDMAKVVLARACEARWSEAIDAADVLSRLDSHYDDCFRFLFEPLPFHAFFGAPPELLARLCGHDVTTMALAGSAPRGATTDEDARNADELLASTKDNHEHRLVREMIVERLTPLTEQLDLPIGPQVLSLHNIHHLLTPIVGRLVQTDPANILDLVRALHPTPALGGVPVNRALAFIRDHEPMPRGWYAAPVGWFDRNLNGEFAVAIRSAISQYDRAWLYAGAGIVADSVAEREWAETALKFRPMLEALGFGQEPTV